MEEVFSPTSPSPSPPRQTLTSWDDPQIRQADGDVNEVETAVAGLKSDMELAVGHLQSEVKRVMDHYDERVQEV